MLGETSMPMIRSRSGHETIDCIPGSKIPSCNGCIERRCFGATRMNASPPCGLRCLPLVQPCVSRDAFPPFFLCVFVGCSLFVPLVSYQKSARTTSVVVPVECGSDVEMVSSMAGALPIARAGGEMGDLFGQFCRKHLCMESWDFIVEVCKYEQLVGADTNAGCVTLAPLHFLKNLRCCPEYRRNSDIP